MQVCDTGSHSVADQIQSVLELGLISILWYVHV
jgi:hypothetical protein